MARFTTITNDAEFASYEDRLDHTWPEGPSEDYVFPIITTDFDPWAEVPA